MNMAGLTAIDSSIRLDTADPGPSCLIELWTMIGWCLVFDGYDVTASNLHTTPHSNSETLKRAIKEIKPREQFTDANCMCW